MQARLDVQEHGDKKALDNAGADEVMKQVGAKDEGLPFFAFLNEKGETLVNSNRPGAGNIGHPFKPEEVDWFLDMLKKGAPAMSPSEAKVLETYLRAQKK